jgi:hypothetical protein
MDPPNWGQHGWYYIKDWPRKQIRIADIDGDGICDIIYLDRYSDVDDWYKTEYMGPGSSSFKFTSQGPLKEMGLCNERDGVGLFDLAVRFADLK